MLQASENFTAIQAFGDSYADTGNLLRLLGTATLLNYPTGRFSGGTNLVDTTSYLLRIPQFNYAVGGATTGSINVVGPGLPGFLKEWTDFIAAGHNILPTGILEISIGLNDARAYAATGGTIAGLNAAATASTNQAIQGINALIGRGARTIVFTTNDVGTLPQSSNDSSSAIGAAFSRAYNSQTQKALGDIARSGVRVENIDIALISQQIRSSPATFGIANIGVCPGACVGNPTLQNQYLYYDAVHLTSRGFAVVGQYIVNRLNAPLTFVAPSELATFSVTGIAATLSGRLDQFREYGSFRPTHTFLDDKNANPKNSFTTTNPWSFYMLGNGGNSHRLNGDSGRTSDLQTMGGTIGLEYQLNKNSMIGSAFDISNPKTQVIDNDATTEVRSYSWGLYGTWANAQFFTQVFASIGRQDYRNSRPGIIDTISSRSAGTSFSASSKVGYLFDAGPFRFGPITGLTYANTHINGYTEIGDPVLTFAVGSQSEGTLIASVGAQLRMPFDFDGGQISPYVNLTLENDLLNTARKIQYGATSASLIVNDWNPIRGTNQVYGRVSGGVTMPLALNVAFTGNLSRTLNRKGGDDFYSSGGIRISF